MSNADKKLVFIVDGDVKSAADAMRGLDTAIKKVGVSTDVTGTALEDLQKAAKAAADVAEDAARRQVEAQGKATAAVAEHEAAEKRVAAAVEASAQTVINSQAKIKKARKDAKRGRADLAEDLEEARLNREDVRASTKGDRSKAAVKARMDAQAEVKAIRTALEAREKADARALKSLKAQEKARRADAETAVKLAREEAAIKLSGSKEAGRAARAVAREALVATDEVERRIATAQKLVDKLEQQASPDGQRDAAMKAYRIKDDESIKKRIADMERMRDVALQSEKTTANERAQIEAASAAAIARERAKLNSVEVKSMERLGLRRKQQIQEEIADVRKAGQDAAAVYAKGSGERLRIERAAAAQIKALNKELAASTASAFTQRMEQAGEALQGLGQGLTGAGQALAPASLAAGAAVGFSVRDAANFEQQVQSVKALYRFASEEELKAVEDLTRERGANNKSFDAQEIGKAAEILASQDVAIQDVLDGALDAVISAAAGTGSDIESAAKLVTQAGNIFGIAAKDLQGVSDTAAGLLDISKFGVQDLALAMAQGGSVAKTAGLNFEEFSAIIGVMSKSFESGSDAGTSFKTFIQSLTSDTDAAVAARNLLGFDPFDSKGELRDPRELIAALEKAKGKLTTEEFIGALTDQFGSDAARAAASLADGGVATYDKAVEGVQRGDAEAARAIREEGLNAELNALGNAFKEFNIAVGESGILETVTGWVQWATDMVKWISELNPWILKLGTSFLIIVAVAAPLLLILGRVAFAISQIAMAWPAVLAAFASFSGYLSTTALSGFITAALAGVKALAIAIFGLPSLPMIMLAGGLSLAVLMFKDEITAVVDWAVQKFSDFWNWLTGGGSSAPPANLTSSSSTPPRPSEMLAGTVGSTPAFADGGRVRGPGTSRSDSVFARLSDGENVISARATRFWGQGLMDGINNMDPSAVLRPMPVPVPVSSGAGAGLHAVTLDLRDGPVDGFYGTEDAVDKVRRHIAQRRSTQYAKPSRASS